MTLFVAGPFAGMDETQVLALIEQTDDEAELDALMFALEDAAAWQPWPYQRAPEGDWSIWYFRGGRGTGKSDGLAHWMNQHAEGPPCDPRLPGGHRMSIVAPTFGDAVESCVRGPSGLMAHNPDVVLTSSLGVTIVRWPNGSEARLFGGHTPGDVSRFRGGGNRCACWIEEAAAIPQLDGVLEQVPFAHRLGRMPRVAMSTTPKPRPALKRLEALAKVWVESGVKPRKRWDRVIITHGTTDQNLALDPEVREGLYDLYGGTRLGRQELEGLMLDDYAGALWQRAEIEALGIRDPSDLPPMVRRYVGVDPSTWGLKIGDRQVEAGELARGIETGIVVSGITQDRVLWTMADRSKRCSPAEWGALACETFWSWNCHGLVFEANAGGAMGPTIIAAAEKALRVEQPDRYGDKAPVRLFREKATRIGVLASDGKRARAEMFSPLTEQGRHRFLLTGTELLVDQLVQWDPDESWSPDRLDAMVWSAVACNPNKARTRPRGVTLAGQQV